MKNYNPLVSILIASYNASSYIEETLDSCVNQSYKNIEIIISDDFSTDNTLSIICQWHSKLRIHSPHIRCVVLDSQANNGITANFNNALLQAEGKWIKCLGSDDILSENAVEEFVHGLCLLPDFSKLGVVFTYFETFGTKVNVPSIYPSAWTKMVIKKKPSNIKKNLAMIHFNNVAPGAFINRDFFDAFDCNYKMLEDLPLWLKIINKDVETLFMDFVSVKYRIHNNQITSNNNNTINVNLLGDLYRVNEYRRVNNYSVAFLHHRFNLFCMSKNNILYKYFKIINPINVIIRLFEKLNK